MEKSVPVVRRVAGWIVSLPLLCIKWVLNGHCIGVECANRCQTGVISASDRQMGKSVSDGCQIDVPALGYAPTNFR